MKKQLPSLFLTRMKEQLADEYDAFLACYEEAGFHGLRVNTMKISVEEFLKITPFDLVKVPWTDNGFYYKTSDPVTRHPHYFAGLYYIQEPSAMLPASRLPVDPGDKVLDLCAAPGGKTTELASKLNGTGLLISNDVSSSRAKAIVKNLTIWGCTNSCITGETPERLLQAFGYSYFDKILVDAPCSGEGMFRKDSGLIDSWIEKGPEEYAQIQKEILESAYALLKPDGMLIYSTCTFSKTEDEDVILNLLTSHPDMKLVRPEWYDGFSEGDDPCSDSIRLWPHKIRGEGHFCALLQKKGPDPLEKTDQRSKPASSRPILQALPKEVKEFFEQVSLASFEDKIYKQIGDQCYFVPDMKVPQKLRYLLTGLLVGTLKKGRFEPSQALAMVFGKEDYPNVFNLSSDDERVLRYLKGETIDLSSEEAAPLKKGWVLICVDGFGLGWAKSVGDSLKNKYYAGWRLQ